MYYKDSDGNIIVRDSYNRLSLVERYEYEECELNEKELKKMSDPYVFDHLDKAMKDFNASHASAKVKKTPKPMESSIIDGSGYQTYTRSYFDSTIFTTGINISLEKAATEFPMTESDLTKLEDLGYSEEEAYKTISSTPETKKELSFKEKIIEEIHPYIRRGETPPFYLYSQFTGAFGVNCMTAEGRTLIHNIKPLF